MLAKEHERELARVEQGAGVPNEFALSWEFEGVLEIPGGYNELSELVRLIITLLVLLDS